MSKPQNDDMHVKRPAELFGAETGEGNEEEEEKK